MKGPEKFEIKNKNPRWRSIDSNQKKEREREREREGEGEGERFWMEWTHKGYDPLYIQREVCLREEYQRGASCEIWMYRHFSCLPPSLPSPLPSHYPYLPLHICFLLFIPIPCSPSQFSLSHIVSCLIRQHMLDSCSCPLSSSHLTSIVKLYANQTQKNKILHEEKLKYYIWGFLRIHNDFTKSSQSFFKKEFGEKE